MSSFRPPLPPLPLQPPPQPLPQPYAVPLQAVPAQAPLPRPRLPPVPHPQQHPHPHPHPARLSPLPPPPPAAPAPALSPVPLPLPTPGLYGSPAPPPAYASPAMPPARAAVAQPRRISAGSHDGVISPASTAAPPALALALPLPDAHTLATAREKALALGDPHRLIQWAADVVKYVERTSASTTAAAAAAAEAAADHTIKDPLLVAWVDEAITIINAHAAKRPHPIPRALYLRADLRASGAFPSYHPRDLRSAFADFEIAARMGYAPAYFRCARDYEVLGDLVRARDVYDKGMAKGDVCCTYRIGMANLLGQLGVVQNLPRAVQLLKDAADRADLETPQPAYIYGIILAGEFTQVTVPPNLLMPALVSEPTRANLTPQQQALFEAEAFRHISRAAYLHFGPAQLKCGWAFEHAQLGCAFDPLLSVQYYILASQAGELEADLNLSKWFLCGAEGFFPKKEDLAFVFADRAARKGLPSAEFALGYYYEVGVGTDTSVELAQKWYRKAAAHGNTDAQERLDELGKPQPQAISRSDHQAHVDTRLVRKRTQAKMRSDREGRRPTAGVDDPALASVHGGGGGGAQLQQQQQQQAVDISRRRTMKMIDEYTAGRRQSRQEASLPATLPSSTSTSSSASASASASMAPRVQQGQHGQGYSLSETYAPSSSSSSSSSAAAAGGGRKPAPPPMPIPAPVPAPGAVPAVVPVHAPLGPGVGVGVGVGPGMGMGMGVGPGAGAVVPPPSHPPLPSNFIHPIPEAGGKGGGGGGGRKSHGGGGGVALPGAGGAPPPLAAGPGAGAGAGAGADGTVYNTFAEMGFASKPSHGEKDCVIM